MDEVKDRRSKRRQKLSPAPRTSLQPGRPLPDDTRHLGKHIFLALAGAFANAEAVVSRVQKVQGRAFAELLTDGLQQIQLRQFIPCAAEEEHRDGDRAKVFGALRVGLAGLVEGEGEEDQSSHTVEGRFRGRRGGHATAEGVAAGQERQRMLESSRKLLEAIRTAQNWYADAADKANELWAFTRNRDKDGVDWTGWALDVQRLLSPSNKPDFNEARPIDNTGLTFATALQFDVVSEARERKRDVGAAARHQ